LVLLAAFSRKEKVAAVVLPMLDDHFNLQNMNRDLWLLCKQERMTQSELDQEVASLNRLLYHVESWSQFCIANEILDINRRKRIHKPHLMQAALKDKIKPFVFVNCLN
jgi:hypothetical protein